MSSMIIVTIQYKYLTCVQETSVVAGVVDYVVHSTPTVSDLDLDLGVKVVEGRQGQVMLDDHHHQWLPSWRSDCVVESRQSSINVLC